MSTPPVPLPTWGQWRKEPVRKAGLLIRPTTLNEHDRALINGRLSTTHAAKDNNDNDDDRLPTN